MSTPEPPFTRELGLLASAELGVLGRVTESTNLTLVVEFGQGDDYAWGIYKPEAGERPLHDFDPGLHARELAAFELSEWLGWHLVPPTVVRHDAPVGVGSVQWFVENDGEHYFTLLEQRPETHDQLRRMALFDVITNNTDRKGGHVLADAQGGIWAIDHGLCFAAAFKLRTVIWDFAGEPVAPDVLADLAPLADAVPDEIAELLDEREVRALRRRTRRLLDAGILPSDDTGRAWPWPLI